jgi:hypothetical protein
MGSLGCDKGGGLGWDKMEGWAGLGWDGIIWEGGWAGTRWKVL